MTSTEAGLTPDAVRDVVRFQLGTVPTSVRRLPSFVGNQNFLVQTARRDYVLKAAPSEAVATEAWLCDRVRAAGVPAPEIVVVDLGRRILPWPYILMVAVPGRSLTSGGHERIVEAGRLLRAIHDINLDGYGPLSQTVTREGGPRGLYDSWAEFLSVMVGALDRLVGQGLLDDQLTDRLRTAVHDHHAMVAGVQRSALLHGDLCPDHIFAAHGHVSGIIDWGQAAAGDPLFDLATWANAAPLDALIHGYQPDADPELHLKIAFYRVASALQVIVDENSATTSWYPGLLQGTRNALDLLDQAT
jgi:aminoglycoside phosphotransferase (APT) family kinase protein